MENVLYVFAKSHIASLSVFVRHEHRRSGTNTQLGELATEVPV